MPGIEEMCSKCFCGSVRYPNYRPGDREPRKTTIWACMWRPQTQEGTTFLGLLLCARRHHGAFYLFYLLFLMIVCLKYSFSIFWGNQDSEKLNHFSKATLLRDGGARIQTQVFLEPQFPCTMGLARTLFKCKQFNYIIIFITTVNNSLIVVKINVKGKTQPFPLLYGVLQASLPRQGCPLIEQLWIPGTTQLISLGGVIGGLAARSPWLAKHRGRGKPFCLLKHKFSFQGLSGVSAHMVGLPVPQVEAVWELVGAQTSRTLCAPLTSACVLLVSLVLGWTSLRQRLPFCFHKLWVAFPSVSIPSGFSKLTGPGLPLAGRRVPCRPLCDIWHSWSCCCLEPFRPSVSEMGFFLPPSWVLASLSLSFYWPLFLCPSPLELWGSWLSCHPHWGSGHIPSSSFLSQPYFIFQGASSQILRPCWQLAALWGSWHEWARRRAANPD